MGFQQFQNFKQNRQNMLNQELASECEICFELGGLHASYCQHANKEEQNQHANKGEFASEKEGVMNASIVVAVVFIAVAFLQRVL
jgi:hypothetical protein